MSGRVEREQEPRLRSLLWNVIGRPLFRLTFHNWYRPRRLLLAFHGARLGRNAKFRRTVDIDRPWNLTAGDLVMIGDGTVIRARRPLVIGARTVVSQLAVLATECRNAGQEGFPPLAEPIVIGSDCWIAADALVLPGSIVREGAVVGARSTVEGELPAWQVAIGEPAVPRRRREWRTSDRPGRSGSAGP